MKGFSGFGEGTSPAKKDKKYDNVTMNEVTGDKQDDRQANKEAQMSYTDEYAKQAFDNLKSNYAKGKKMNYDKGKDGRENSENAEIVRAYRDQQKNVKAGKDSAGNSIAKKKKKGESSLDYNRRVKGVNRGGRPGNYKGPKTPQVGKTVKGSRRKIV